MGILDRYKYGEVIYENFKLFVVEVLAPHFKMPFVDEKELQFNLWYSSFREQFTVDEVCRGGGKSEFDIWVAIYCAVFKPINRFSGMREQETILLSADNTTTEELRIRISDYFFDSPILNPFIPGGISKKDEKNPRWNQKVLELINGSKIYFRSIKTKRGLHVDRIIIDDPTTESSTLTDRQTENFVLGAILPMGTRKNAIVSFTGTPLRYTDILKVMSDKENFVSSKYPLLDIDGNITLPKSFSEESIEKIKSNIGSRKFSAEYLLNPIASDVSLIRQEWVESCFREDLSVKDVSYDELYMGVDFAFSDAVKADFSAFVDVGVNYNENGTLKELIVLNIEWAKGLSLNQHWEKIDLKYQSNRHDTIFMEENSIKGSVKDIRSLNIPFKFFWMGSRDAKNREAQTAFKAKTIGKIPAINRLAVMFEYGKIVIPYKTEREKTIGNRLLQELISWALEDEELVEYGIHPDAPIALIMVNEGVRGGSGVV